MERNEKKLEWVDPELVKLGQTHLTINGDPTTCGGGSDGTRPD